MSVPPRAVQLNEANAFLKDHPEVLYVDLLIADMNGVVRGKRIECTSLHKVYEKGINLPPLCLHWISMAQRWKAPAWVWISVTQTESVIQSPTPCATNPGKSAQPRSC